MLLQNIRTKDPWLIVGSPKCGPFATLMDLNKTTEKVRKALQEGIQHLVTVCNVYKGRVKMGRFFLHKHPDNASRWGLWMIQEVLSMEGVQCVDNDQCAFGLLCDGASGPALVRKPIRTARTGSTRPRAS